MNKFVKGVLLGSVVSFAAYEVYKNLSKKIKEKKEEARINYNSYREEVLQNRDIKAEVEELLNKDKFSPYTRVWYDEYIHRKYLNALNYVPLVITDKTRESFKTNLDRFDEFMNKMHRYDAETLLAFKEQKEREAEEVRREREKRMEREIEIKKINLVSNAIRDVSNGILSGTMNRGQYDMDKYKILADSLISVTTGNKKEE